jgi:hypothetical protein
MTQKQNQFRPILYAVMSPTGWYSSNPKFVKKLLVGKNEHCRDRRRVKD